jgi:hypothetical protein
MFLIIKIFVRIPGFYFCSIFRNKFFLKGTGKSGEGKAETGKGAGKIPGEGSKVRDTSRVWKDKREENA